MLLRHPGYTPEAMRSEKGGGFPPFSFVILPTCSAAIFEELHWAHQPLWAWISYSKHLSYG